MKENEICAIFPKNIKNNCKRVKIANFTKTI